jgi:putative nucleotidyltransferase with HDIG domain
MKPTTRAYAITVMVATCVAIVFLYTANSRVTSAQLAAIAFLATLAVLAEMLAYVLSSKAKGSIAFIPYLALVVLVPSWVAAVAVVVVKLLIEAFGRATSFKATFNAFTHGLTISIGVATYSALGGSSLLDQSGVGIGQLSSVLGAPALVAFLCAFAVNMVVVAGVIAIDNGERMLVVLRTGASTIGADLLTTPIVFVFAWLYSSFGAIAAAAAWAPLIGIRHLNRVQLELEETNQELLQLMVKSIEARDPYTSGHSRRVSKYAAAIAQALRLPNREIQSIATAALLHDVGKIYEKYAPILRNPGRLTPEEWTTMQEHPVDGANLVSTISRLRNLVPAVRHHHENWDGSGYPDRISGNEIPLASRIIMFADTIDAMTSERSYRRPLSEMEVRAEIIRCRGKQFDPAIADQLLASDIWRTLFPELKGTGSRALALVPSDSARGQSA